MEMKYINQKSTLKIQFLIGETIIQIKNNKLEDITIDYIKSIY